ncbi:translation initiation factor IF-2-like isoform X2 [Manacus candei]|uniref:translation initiation factor IF-2-like isoform X2 n=1 Tax=Manacus candei TaxID=415023 RepID=UPI0022274B39|nr:translation initiation factor IF-2-like isoform X2 [Manacus candei]
MLLIQGSQRVSGGPCHPLCHLCHPPVTSVTPLSPQAQVALPAEQGQGAGEPRGTRGSSGSFGGMLLIQGSQRVSGGPCHPLVTSVTPFVTSVTPLVTSVTPLFPTGTGGPSYWASVRGRRTPRNPGVLRKFWGNGASPGVPEGVWWSLSPPCHLCPPQAQVAFLQGERKGQENLKTDLVRRIRMLEYALKQERSKYHKLKFGTELAPGEKPRPEGPEPVSNGPAELSGLEGGAPGLEGGAAAPAPVPGGGGVQRHHPGHEVPPGPGPAGPEPPRSPPRGPPPAPGPPTRAPQPGGAPPGPPPGNPPGSRCC